MHESVGLYKINVLVRATDQTTARGKLTYESVRDVREARLLAYECKSSILVLLSVLITETRLFLARKVFVKVHSKKIQNTLISVLSRPLLAQALFLNSGW